jgi:hypothetical protein
MKADPAAVYRLVVEELNIPVTLSEVSITPLPTSQRGDRIAAASFNFAQQGELPFEAVL